MEVLALTSLLRQGEGETIEFKRSADSGAGKVICAFLNTNGGTLLIGVDDEGNLTEYEKEAEKKVADLIGAISPRPHIEIEKLEIDKKKILVVKVKKSEKLHAFGNVGYIRIGSTTRELDLMEIVEKAGESLLVRFDEAPCIGATISDLAQKNLINYFKKRKNTRKVSTPNLGNNTWEMIKAATKGKVTNAGILFFSDYPEKFYPQVSLRFIEFTSNDMKNVAEERIFTGNIWKISDETGKFLADKIAKESTLKGFEKIVALNFPLEALREAVNNALIHRNYFDLADVRIFLFPDRIEIVNPGSFPPGITPQAPTHSPRNPIICQYFYDIGKIEKYGSGLFKMKELCKQDGYPEPEFQLSARQTKVTFNFLPLKIREAMKELDERDKQILEKISQSKYTNTKQLTKVIQLSKDSLVTRLNQLIGKNLILKTGKGRATTYALA